MNIWSLKKDQSIKLLLILLTTEISLDHFNISLTDTLHKKSIRFNDTQVDGLSAYIFCYGQSQSQYGVHLEYPEESTFYIKQADVFENLSLKQLVDILTIHFNITCKV